MHKSVNYSNLQLLSLDVEDELLKYFAPSAIRATPRTTHVHSEFSSIPPVATIHTTQYTRLLQLPVARYYRLRAVFKGGGVSGIKPPKIFDIIICANYWAF